MLPMISSLIIPSSHINAANCVSVLHCTLAATTIISALDVVNHNIITVKRILDAKLCLYYQSSVITISACILMHNCNQWCVPAACYS